VGQEGGSTYNFSLRIYLASAMQSTHLQSLLRMLHFPVKILLASRGGGSSPLGKRVYIVFLYTLI